MPRAFHIIDRYMALKRCWTRRDGLASGVLLISAGGLGDIVLFSHVLPRFLALAGPDETVTVLLRHNAAKMAFLFPKGVQTKAVNFDRLPRDLGYRRQVQAELFAEHYRLVVHTDYLRHPHLDEVLVAACAAPETAAMEPRPWPKYDRTLKRNRALYERLLDGGGMHVDKVLRWAAFADGLTGKTLPPPSVHLPGNLLAPPAALEAPTVLIQAFSAVKLKQSPPALYAALLDALPDGYEAVFLGAPNDLDKNPEYAPLLERPNVRLDTSLFKDLVPLLRAAKLVVSVDTALMHLAVAVGAPTLCLGSAAYVGEIVPYDASITPDNVRFLYVPMDCQGCLGACTLPPEDGMYPCVARVGRDNVLAATAELLDQN